MYIYPNTELRILTGVNLNNDYDHTIYFSSESARMQYFLNKTKYTLTNQSYQRKERGWIQVDINQNSLWDCTYLMYKNTAYHNKWFYAFILSVEYVNDSVSKINFEIDVLQTWDTEYILDACLVEREHTLTDTLFGNTIPENLDIGLDYYSCEKISRELFESNRLLVITTTDANNQALRPGMRGNVFSGLYYYTYDLSDPTDKNRAADFLQNMVTAGLENNIVMIVQYPDFLGQVQADYDGYGHYNVSFVPNFSTISGYAPRNNKLFCYPYNYMLVTDKEGSAKEYKWEMWGNGHAGEFIVEGTGIGSPVVRISPLFYRTSGFQINLDESLVHDNFPVCAWVGDSFQVWLAQNRYQMQGQLVGSLIGGISSITPGLISDENPEIYSASHGLSSIINGAISTFTKMADGKHMPKEMHGKLSEGILNIQNNSAGFDLKQMAIPYEYAVIVDQFFSRFGYACGQIKVPNRNARVYWTYTKTKGCEISGNVPSDDLVKIKAIYDHGITFWNNGDNIGNYGNFTNPTYS